ncbi:MAG: DEAD/DEAH box helicase [Oleiphilaceae bacterium]|nr:DEAD/DEAH box helicase [Oleiphilaceae bacterium]
MKITPRDYQQDAHDAAIEWIKKSIEPCLIEAPTGAGKSIIVALLANTIFKMSKKRILCLAPTSELVTQNRAKYLLTGEPASMFSASAGRKELKHPVVFGSPGTVKNSVEKFRDGYAAVIVDEAHGITPTLMEIIRVMREGNPKLRVIGLSATPYRLGTGYIYASHYERGFNDEDCCIEPYFTQLVYSIDARMLIARGYLSEPVFTPTGEHYDTSGLTLNSMGQFSKDSVERAFTGKGRKTSRIVADVIDKSQGKQGVMIFASTIQHAQEVMESLPPDMSALVTGDPKLTPKKERERIINEFKEKRIKYLVNVAVLTTGFDAPHVDHIAILRATESVALLQQIVGRGLRVDEGKSTCLISDYAENIDRHAPHGDIFDPDIKAKRKGEGEPIIAICESCGYHNEFSARENPDEMLIDDNGYFVDGSGDRINTEEGLPIPAHYGRRCKGMIRHPEKRGEVDRCGYKWTFKSCEECGHENDVAARFCTKCRSEIVDPNEKLRIEAAKVESDPYRIRASKVQMMKLKRWGGKDGKPDTVKVDFYIDEKPGVVSTWLAPDADSEWLQKKWITFCQDSLGEEIGIDDIESRMFDFKAPVQIAYRKKRSSKYFELMAMDFNEAPA